jgi:hypothetical protein
MKTTNDNLLAFEIRRWDADENKWNIQEAGNGELSMIMRDWKDWTEHSPLTQYQLVLIVTQEILLDETTIVKNPLTK